MEIINVIAKTCELFESFSSEWSNWFLLYCWVVGKFHSTRPLAIHWSFYLFASLGLPGNSWGGAQAQCAIEGFGLTASWRREKLYFSICLILLVPWCLLTLPNDPQPLPILLHFLSSIYVFTHFTPGYFALSHNLILYC